MLAPPPSTRYLPPSDALRASWLGGARTTRSAVGRQPSAWSCLSSAWPPRLADTPARALDLRAHYTDPLHDTRDLTSSFIIHNKAMGNLCGVPMGLQRLRGVDYDIRGLVRLPGTEAQPIELQIPHGRYAAAHVLSAIGAPPYDFNLADPLAQLEFHYADGSRALQPWRTQLEVDHDRHPGYWPEVALAWQGVTPRDEVGPGMGSTLYTTRVANPHPQRLVVGLSLHAASPAIYDQRVLVAAITLAPL